MKIKTIDLKYIVDLCDEYKNMSVETMIKLCQTSMDVYHQLSLKNEVLPVEIISDQFPENISDANKIEEIISDANKIGEPIEIQLPENIPSKIISNIQTLKPSPMISIVMSYYNRYRQLETTLDSIEHTRFRDIEVIIVDDCSDSCHDIKNLIYKYSYVIKLVIVGKGQKKWINPCVPYNIGLRMATGKKIIIQNPEVCHIGDVITHVVNNLQVGQYFTFSVYASPSFTHNENVAQLLATGRDGLTNNFIGKINYEDYNFNYEFYKSKYNDISGMNSIEAHDHFIEKGISTGRSCNSSGIYHPIEYINWKGWYQNPTYNNRSFHFLSAICREDLNKIGGFDNAYGNGVWYDDNDLLNRIKKICSVENLGAEVCFGIHLYHYGGSGDLITGSSFSTLVAINRNIYENNIANNIVLVDINNKYTDSDNYKTLDNKIIDTTDFKTAVCIKTYVNETTDGERINIIEKCISSLIANKGSSDVFIFVDGYEQESANNKKHNEMIDKYKSCAGVIKFKKNKGIAGISNYMMKYVVKNGYDVGIICDDDIIFKQGFASEYLKAILLSGIEHLSYYPYTELALVYESIKNMDKKNTYINGKFIVNYQGYAGCLYTITQKMMDVCGFMKILKYKYGYEHELFTKKYYNICKNGLFRGQYDMQDSNNYIELQKSSLDITSMTRDMDKVHQNLLSLPSINLTKKLYYNENGMMISIIIPYYNTYKLLEHTIESINSSSFFNYEIIIVSDCSRDYYKLQELKNKWHHIDIMIINVDPNTKLDEKNHYVPFSIGFSQAKGDVIIIQNPESYHNGDILNYVYENLTNDSCMVFSSYNLTSCKENEAFINLKNKDIAEIDKIATEPRAIKLYQHPIHRNNKYNFCSAVYKENLTMIGGYDAEYTQGHYHDNDLIFKIEKIAKIKIISLDETIPFIVNLYQA